ncbi:MAG: MaoC family dehydratase [bacterium]|nr:MaoC family dehydratase [bacterium]
MSEEIPAEVEAWIGQKRYVEEAEVEVERGFIQTSCVSAEYGNPLFWDEKQAKDITDGWIAPPTMISVWCRPLLWTPERNEEGLALKVHFDLKEALNLPEAIMSADELVFHAPVRIGDRVRNWQVLRSLSDWKTTRLGRGRFWSIEVVYVNQDQELLVQENITGFGYRREN